MKIFCLESWSGRLNERSSVRPLLELLETEAEIPFFHQRVDTREQLHYYLDRWADVKTYELGFLAMHGEPGKVEVGSAGGLAVSDLIDRTTDRDGDDEYALDLSGKSIYFGSCSTMNDGPAMKQLKEETGLKLVCGYTKDVDWMESAAFELLLLQRLAASQDHVRALRPLLRDHKALVKHLGFTAVPKVKPAA